MTGLLMLTEAQRRVVALVAEGHPDKVIAHRFGRSEGTVKRQLSDAMRRLNLTNRVQLAVWYVRQEMETEVDDKKPWHDCSPAEREERLRANGL